MNDWHLEFQDEEYLNLSRNRLNKNRSALVWCQQVAKIINSYFEKNQIINIGDFGCNVGHLCRVLDRINANKLEYTGFDISKTYLDIAKKTFPKRKFVSMDIEKYNYILEHDISVCSATIEHLTNENLALANILKATRNILILRTFLGDINKSDLYTKKQAKSSYPINQFSFKNIALIAEKHGFHSKFIKDEATDSIPQYLGCGIIRTQYIAILKRV